MRRVPTYIRSLDTEVLEGGIPENSVSLVSGLAGTMKTTVCYNMMHHNAVNDDRPGLFITMEQNEKSLRQHLGGLGFETTQTGDKLRIMDLAMMRRMVGDSSLSLQFIIDQIREVKSSMNVQLVAIDSLAALLVLASLEDERNALFHFISNLKDLEVTTNLISEMDEDSKRHSPDGVAGFQADGIIVLRSDLVDGKARRKIRVVKMRGTRHSQDEYNLVVDAEGFSIVTL